MAIVSYNYGDSLPTQRPPTQVANWDDWGRKRCDDASKAGLFMVGGGIFAKNPNLAMAGILVSIFPQLIKEIFFPREQ